MILKFFIIIVLIAEIIIVSTIVWYLVKTDKKLIECNKFVNDVKPLIKDIMQTSKKISEQFLEFAPIIEQNLKTYVANIIIGQLKNAIGAFTFWLVKKEVEKHV